MLDSVKFTQIIDRLVSYHQCIFCLLFNNYNKNSYFSFILFVCYNKNFIIINEFLKNIQYICKLRKYINFNYLNIQILPNKMKKNINTVL